MNRTNYGLIVQGGRLVVTRTPRAAFLDPRFLLAPLLEHVACGDGWVCEREMAAMIGLVAEHFGLDEGCAEEKFIQALDVYAQSLDLEQVGAILQEILEPGEREEVVCMLLEVIAADGRQGADELAALDEVAAVLNISGAERHAAFERYFSRRESGRG